MATLSPETAKRIAELKDLESQALNSASDIFNSPEFRQADSQLIPLEKEKELAFAAFVKARPGAESDAAKSAYDSIQATYAANFKTWSALSSQAVGYKTDALKYQIDIIRVSGVQTTSPAPTLEQDKEEAEEAGKIASTAPQSVPPKVDTFVPEVDPYNPATKTTVTNEEVRSTLPDAGRVVTLPVVVVTSEPETGENKPQTPISEPVFIFNQSQLDYLESYNQSLIDAGREDLIVSDLTSDEALTFLSEQGLIQSDDESPIDQQTISRGVLGDPAIDSEFTETFPPEDIQTISGDPAIDSEFTETFPPEQQLEIDSSDRYVKTLDLTADPLGDLINQIQSGNRQQNSLPTRNQQMAAGSPKDWRFRISLSPSANYLYKDANPGILRPLQATNGVIYPYTPSITVNYVANYSTSELTHSNYKIYNYKNSSVETINIVGDFTVQDSAEANYVLAVIHFFKSVTKMFYGQDQNPIRGTPPPLVYLTGFGQYQFDMHPVVITNFTHTFPTDVDYVNAYPTNNSSAIGGQNMQPYMPQIAQFISPLDRLRTLGSKIRVGGTAPPPTFINSQNINEVTRVPSKINIQLTCLPIVTRNAVSNTFSLRKYASGELMRGSVNFGRTGGGMW